MIQEPLISQQSKEFLSQEIQKLYEHQLEHQVHEIAFYLFERTLVIIMEGVVTQPEKLLNYHSQQQLAKKVRTVLDRTIRPQIKMLVEEILEVKVIDFLCDTATDVGIMGVIAIFERQSDRYPDNEHQ